MAVTSCGEVRDPEPRTPGAGLAGGGFCDCIMSAELVWLRCVHTESAEENTHSIQGQIHPDVIRTSKTSSASDL